MTKIRLRFKKVIFQHNYKKFELALRRYKKPILLLQSIIKGRYAYKTYNLIKKNTIIIQRAYKRHLKKKFYL